MKYDGFISYHWSIEQSVTVIVKNLTTYCCFNLCTVNDLNDNADDIEIENFLVECELKIRNSSMIICFLTKNYLESKLCFFQVYCAYKHNKRFIIVHSESNLNQHNSYKFFIEHLKLIDKPCKKIFPEAVLNIRIILEE